MEGSSSAPDHRGWFGATGSGKGVGIREWLGRDKPRRLIVWDPLGEYGAFVDITVGTLADLGRYVERRKAFRVAFYPGPNAEQFAPLFELFCRIVWSVGDVDCLVEELADVTRPSWAPPPWRRLCKQGRHRRVRLRAASQRPADVDKAFLQACTYIRVHMLEGLPDEKVMAARMKVPLADIQSLRTVEQGRKTTIAYIEKDFRSQKTTKATKVLTRK